MIFRRWLFELETGRIIVGALLIAIVLGVGITHVGIFGTSSEPPQSSQQPAARKSNSASAPDTSDQSLAAEYKADCSKREDADLCAQRRAAKAAEEAVVLASPQWVWNLVQDTLTMAAIVFAAWAAVAASKSAKVAERALTDLERPFVNVDVKGGVTASLDGSFDTKGAIECVVSNFGRTPARLIEIETTFKALRTPAWPEPLSASAEGGRPLPDGCVTAVDHPYVELTNAFPLFPPDVLLKGAELKWRLFACGFVRFVDFLGDAYTTGFCFVFDPIGNRWVRRGSEMHNYTRKESA